ncbi:MAG: hypothetical protein A4S09_03485 [Proteobacteria bacterium SG_bin7]|nr:MAG: hypothetical protein A4S09_03485 [Proteobacteria bacterium SG_bin7]
MYVELKCKSNFSFLRGSSHPEELIARAIELGYPAIALTDNDGVYGMPKAYWKAKDFPNFKLIVGADLNIENHPRLTLLAQNRKAYGVLCKIITESHRDKPKGNAAIELEKLLAMATETHGLICLPEEKSNYEILKENFNERLFLPLTRLKDGKDKKRTDDILEVARRLDLQIVATNDVHFHAPDRRKLQDVLTSIRETTPLTELGFKLFSNGERYLKTPLEMRDLFKDFPNAIHNTLKIAESCTFSPSELKYRYPSEWIPEGHSSQSYLEELTWKGAKEKYTGEIPLEVIKVLRHELGLIKKLQYADYFLTIYEIVDWARKERILCQGRGAAANSVVCYVLGITAVDPIRLNLLFERFISEERHEPPDIDVDFEHERREEVIQHIYDKYGRDRAAMVSAVITYRRRSMIREISKAFGVNIGVLPAKEIEKKFDELVKTSPVANAKNLIEELEDGLKGFPRHLSIHSGGFTLSADPITEIVPVEPARMDGRTIIQWDKYDLDYLGLLKVDILSLGMLSALRKNLDLVGLKLNEIPAEDKKTYQMIGRADTVGTFQIESRAQMSMLGRLQPKSFYDLVIEVAIVRPGPIVGKMVHPYLRRRQGKEAVHYHHPKLKKILGKTLGVPLFQEQVMRMAIELAQFTPGEADQLRRAIGAWRSSGEIEMIGQKLIRGLIASGLPKDFAMQVYDQIKGFAQYGFPESHAASFALLAYASCYLKCHYPAEFCCSLINSQPMGFYANHTLLDDAKRHGAKVLPIDPNISSWDCQMENGALRLGFRIIRGMKEKNMESLVAGRPYTSLGDFLAKNSLRRDVLYRLAMGNAFVGFGMDQRHSLWSILDYDIKSSEIQMDLFHKQSQGDDDDIFKKLSFFENIKSDYNSMGLSTIGHPMQGLRQAQKLPLTTSFLAKQVAPGKEIHAAGLVIIKQRPPTAKGMTFATMEDEFGFLDLVIRPDVYEKHHEALAYNCFLEIKGIVQREGNTVSILVKWAKGILPSFEVKPTQYYYEV